MSYQYYFSLKNKKTGEKSAALHIAALTRQRGRDFELVHLSARLPEWSKYSGYEFFKAADEYEAKNSIVYSELEFALPAKLTLDQQTALVKDFITEQLPDKYYIVVIKQKKEAVSCGIVFSRRIIDKTEEEHPRSAAKFFSRYNSKNPSLGGAKKDTSSNFEKKLRKGFISCLDKYLAEFKPNAAPLSDENLKAVKLKAKLEELRYKRRRLEKQLAAVKKQQEKLQHDLDALVNYVGMPIDADFESVIELIKKKYHLRDIAPAVPVAYNAEQIKQLMAFFSELLAELMESGSHTAKAVLKHLVKLKKAVNLQIIKDKYYSKRMNAPAIYYFITDGGNKDASVQKSFVSSQFDPIGYIDLKDVTISDLYSIKLIAEALSGSKRAKTIVRRLEDDSVTRLK